MIAGGIKDIAKVITFLVTHGPALPSVTTMALFFALWAFAPHARVPYFRVQSVKLRLRLRLHPGRGFATAFEAWLHWGRWASFRQSKRTRPQLALLRRAFRPAMHSVFMGRIQYRLGLRLPVQEHLVCFGPPRTHKSGFLARAIMNYHGAVVSTSTKGDMLQLTGGVRQRRRSQVFVFNPQRIGGSKNRSNIRWNLVAGCADPTTAIRRAQALCEAASTEGTEESSFWAEQSAMQMRAMLCAADLAGADFRLVTHWIMSGQTRSAERILTEAGYITWAATLQQMRSGKAERTTATIRLVLFSAVSFMSDPTLAECVIPGPGDAFDIEQFLLTGGSLYLIGEQRGRSAPIAPLFAGLVTEIHYVASLLGSAMKGSRLDPPLLLCLDEVTQIVPIPLPSILADSGGRGTQIIVAAHGIAQLRGRWGNDGARAILDCANLMLVPGILDPDTLELAQRLAGTAPFKTRGEDKAQQLPIAPVEAIRQLPAKRGLVIRTSRAPLVTRLPMAWRDWRYLLAWLRGYAEVRLAAVPSLASAMQVEAELADLPDIDPAVPVSAGGEDFGVADDREPELEPAPAGPSAHLAGPGTWLNGTGVNGHGVPQSRNGHAPANGQVTNGNGGRPMAGVDDGPRDPWGGAL